MSNERTCLPWCAYQTPHDHLASGDLVESGKGPTLPGVVSLKCATAYPTPPGMAPCGNTYGTAAGPNWRTTRIVQPEGNPE